MADVGLSSAAPSAALVWHDSTSDTVATLKVQLPVEIAVEPDSSGDKTFVTSRLNSAARLQGLRGVETETSGDMSNPEDGFPVGDATTQPRGEQCSNSPREVAIALGKPEGNVGGVMCDTPGSAVVDVLETVRGMSGSVDRPGGDRETGGSENNVKQSRTAHIQNVCADGEGYTMFPLVTENGNSGDTDPERDGQESGGNTSGWYLGEEDDSVDLDINEAPDELEAQTMASNRQGSAPVPIVSIRNADLSREIHVSHSYPSQTLLVRDPDRDSTSTSVSRINSCDSLPKPSRKISNIELASQQEVETVASPSGAGKRLQLRKLVEAVTTLLLPSVSRGGLTGWGGVGGRVCVCVCGGGGVVWSDQILRDR